MTKAHLRQRAAYHASIANTAWANAARAAEELATAVSARDQHAALAAINRARSQLAEATAHDILAHEFREEC